MNCYDSGWWNVFFLAAPALLPVNARSACVPQANQSGAVVRWPARPTRLTHLKHPDGGLRFYLRLP